MDLKIAWLQTHVCYNQTSAANNMLMLVFGQQQKCNGIFMCQLTFLFAATSELIPLCQIEALQFATNVSALELLYNVI